jgi:hypothetical protein
MDEMERKVDQLHITVFGHENQGGMLREVNQMRCILADHEKRLNLISLKWLALVFLVGLVGNALGNGVLNLVHVTPFLGK